MSLLKTWLLLVPLACGGALAGHEVAYALTGTPSAEVHGYLAHVPQLGLLMATLSLVGAAVSQRGSKVVLWPFPAVVVGGFVAQEHLERIAHGDAAPFILDKPFFLVGLGVQTVVAVAAWLVARALVRVVGRRPQRRPRHAPAVIPVLTSPRGLPVGAMVAGASGARAPPALVR